jgi:hypothetical protein
MFKWPWKFKVAMRYHHLSPKQNEISLPPRSDVRGSAQPVVQILVYTSTTASSSGFHHEHLAAISHPPCRIFLLLFLQPDPTPSPAEAGGKEDQSGGERVARPIVDSPGPRRGTRKRNLHGGPATSRHPSITQVSAPSPPCCALLSSFSTSGSSKRSSKSGSSSQELSDATSSLS